MRRARLLLLLLAALALLPPAGCGAGLDAEYGGYAFGGCPLPGCCDLYACLAVRCQGVFQAEHYGEGSVEEQEALHEESRGCRQSCLDLTDVSDDQILRVLQSFDTCAVDTNCRTCGPVLNSEPWEG